MGLGGRVRTQLKSDQRDIETEWGSDRQITRGGINTTGRTSSYHRYNSRRGHTNPLLSLNTFYPLNMPI